MNRVHDWMDGGARRREIVWVPRTLLLNCFACQLSPRGFRVHAGHVRREEEMQRKAPESNQKPIVSEITTVNYLLFFSKLET